MRKLSYSLHALVILSFIVFHTSPASGQSDRQSSRIPDTTLAKTLFEKAETAINNGNLDSTQIWLAQALPSFKTADQWQYQVRSYHILSGVYYRTGKADLAGHFLDTALQVLTVKTDSSDLLYAPYYHNRATVFYVLGNYPEAKNLFLKAIGIYQSFPESMNRKIISSYNNLGLTFNELRDYESAIVYLQKCLDYYVQYNPENKYLIGRSHNNLGMAYFQKGHSEKETYGFEFTNQESYQKAAEHHQAALDNYKQVLSPPNIALGQCYLNLANIASARQNIGQSINYNKQALVNFGEGSDNPLPQVAEVYYNTGIAYKIVGQLDSSRYYVNRAITSGKMFFGEKHPYLADYYNYLGRVNIEDEKLEDALANFQQSIIICCIDFDDTLYVNNPELSQIIIKEEAMRSFAWKAIALKEKYNHSQDIEDLDLALANYYHFNDMVKIILGGLENEEARLTFMQSVQEIYGDIMEISYQLYAKTANPGYLEDALYFSENEKSAILSAYIDQSMAKKFSGMTDEELMMEKQAQEDLYDFENKFNNLRLSNVTDKALIAAISDSLLQARYHCEKIANDMGEKYPKYARLNYDRNKIKLKETQAMLAHKTATCLEYFQMDTAIYIIAINAKNYDFIKAHPDSTFFDRIVDYRKSTSDFQFINKYPALAYSTFTASSRALYSMLFPESIRPVIEQYPKIIVIPNDVLNYLSFDGLLTTDPDGRNYAELSYLANDYIISYANALRYIETNDKEKSPRLNYAGYAPEYDSTSIASGLSGDEFAMFRNNPGLLKEHKAEVKHAGEIFGGDAYIGNDANEWNFKQTAADYNILHFAMHAQINDDNPLSSKFLFSQFTDNNNEDNFLNTHEIYNLELNARLVVLSACNTAGGILRKGEGVMSLSRAFMYSGVSSIVSSLWLAEDHAANQIISGFFEGINEGLPIDEALYLGRKNYLKTADPIFSHPYYWANFIVMGNNDPVKAIWMFPLKTAAFIALFVMIALVLFYFVFRRRANRVRI
ncbi:MAG: CHAT domain-containing protein [Bacteroidales bacterium]|nr:CHAT domain-containing protein [Bacteroidales bacterium]